MKPGRQWVVWDADFFDNSFTMALIARFGLAGPAVFLAFILACKKSYIPGRINYRTDDQALEMMGIGGAALIDSQGQPWTLDEFWELCGRHKQTRRTRHGHATHIVSTRFGEWQQTLNRANAAERKRRSRAKIERDGHAQDRERDRDIEIERASVTQAATGTPREDPEMFEKTLAEWTADLAGEST